MKGYLVNADRRTTKSSKATYSKGKSITVLNFKESSRVMKAQGQGQAVMVNADALVVGKEIREGVQILIGEKVYQVYLHQTFANNIRKVVLMFIDEYREKDS